MLIKKLGGYYYPQPHSSAYPLLLKLQSIAEEPYSEQITHYITESEKREESKRKRMKQHKDFAEDWIEAWNTHDAGRIASYYTDGIEYQSPFITYFEDAPDGSLHGSSMVQSFAKWMLKTFPDLHFNLLDIYSSMNTTVLHYRSVDNLTATAYFQFHEGGEIIHAIEHYSSPIFISKPS